MNYRPLIACICDRVVLHEFGHMLFQHSAKMHEVYEGLVQNLRGHFASIGEHLEEHDYDKDKFYHSLGISSARSANTADSIEELLKIINKNPGILFGFDKEEIMC